MKRLLLISTPFVLAACLAAPVLACGDEPMAENLVIASRVKDALRSTYADAHPGARGPLRGRSFYGRWNGDTYAVARFESGGRERTVTFFHQPGHAWRAVQETAGTVCTDHVPLELIRAWWLVHTTGRCFAAS
ncbi:MAG: hypothetical protein ABI948_13205 [Thermoleophilia bacterium]